MIAVPPVSQIAALRKPDLPFPPKGKDTGKDKGKDTAESAKDAAGTGRTVAGNSAVARAPVAATPATSPVTLKSPANETGTGEGARAADRNGAGAADHNAASARAAESGTAEPPLSPGVIRIDRPQGGKPSSIVLGVSSREAYPESAGVLACRIAYTVYVQVGLPKSWILQFCLPDANDRIGAARGTVAALDAPWPFRIMRPPITGLNGDYTLVHGVVNTSGRFERLALVTPDEVAKNELVPALQQWEFRSASRDGQPTAVEILLIIPHRQE